MNNIYTKLDILKPQESNKGMSRRISWYLNLTVLVLAILALSACNDGLETCEQTQSKHTCLAILGG